MEPTSSLSCLNNGGKCSVLVFSRSIRTAGLRRKPLRSSKMGAKRGRKHAGAETPPAGRRGEQHRSCRCGEQQCNIEDCNDFKAGATGKHDWSVQRKPVVAKENTTSSTKGTAPRNAEPCVDLNAEAWDFKCDHAGALTDLLRPGVDLRKLARKSTEISWSQIEKWLPGDFASLKAAATPTERI
eukprot:3384211-Rhodomonas_salina.1